MFLEGLDFLSFDEAVAAQIDQTLLSALHRPAPKNEDEMMVAIFEYIDRLFNIVRPRRVLYMAIDGVVNNLADLNTYSKISAEAEIFIPGFM